jgi:hypothetical protein
MCNFCEAISGIKFEGGQKCVQCRTAGHLALGCDNVCPNCNPDKELLWLMCIAQAQNEGHTSKQELHTVARAKAAKVEKLFTVEKLFSAK